MLIILWLCLPDTPGKKIGLTYPQVVSCFNHYMQYTPDIANSSGRWPKCTRNTQPSCKLASNPIPPRQYLQACMSYLLDGWGKLADVWDHSWTTLTFLLSDSPYQYSTLEIGLFGLLGLVGALLSPIWGHLIDQFHPYLAQFVGIWICMISMIIGLTAAKINVGAVCVAIAFYDVGQQLNQLGNGYRVAGIDPNARARLNGCNLLALFAGQVGLHFSVLR